jgi:hypothetical protein
MLLLIRGVEKELRGGLGDSKLRAIGRFYASPEEPSALWFSSTLVVYHVGQKLL